MAKADHDPDSAAPGPPSAEAIAAAARRAAGRGPAPVHLWNPPYCGELDIRVGRDGTWSYLGTPIGRQPLVRLFASILKREGDRFFLVTPVEKVGITVEDAPLFADAVEVEGEGEARRLVFATTTEDVVAAGPEHAIRLAHDPATGEPSPYVHVRRGLEARIGRKTFYRLVDLGVVERTGRGDAFGVWSAGVFFPFLPAEELDR